jgi:hypothetical protein
MSNWVSAAGRIMLLAALMAHAASTFAGMTQTGTSLAAIAMMLLDGALALALVAGALPASHALFIAIAVPCAITAVQLAGTLPGYGNSGSLESTAATLATLALATTSLLAAIALMALRAERTREPLA